MGFFFLRMCDQSDEDFISIIDGMSAVIIRI